MQKETMMEVMWLVEGMEEGGVDGLPVWSQATSSETASCNIPKFLTLSDKESAIVSPLLPVHASEKQGEIKVVPVLIRLLARSTHYSALIGRLAEIGALLMKKVVMTKWVGGTGCRAEKGEWERAWDAKTDAT